MSKERTESLLDDLKEQRLLMVNAMSTGSGWNEDQARKLAELHGAIAAVEAVLKDLPDGRPINIHSMIG